LRMSSTSPFLEARSGVHGLLGESATPAQPSHRHHLPLCHTQDSTPRHSSTLYDAHKSRLRLGRGELGKHSNSLRQAQSTRGEGQASREESSNPATRRPPRQVVATRHQHTPMDNDVRRDVPTAKHCNSFLFPLVPLPLRL
jgi:hypothetical protein